MVLLFLRCTSLLVVTLVRISRSEKSVMKLLVESSTDRVLGAAMVGPDSPEIMQV